MLKFTLLFLLSAPVFALTPHTATYALSISGFEIAIEQRVLSQKDNSYNYIANAKTTGLASLIQDYQIDAESDFIINEFGIHSTHYKYFERKGSKIKKDINIHPKNRQIDPLSLFLAISYALEKNPQQTDFDFIVNNGKKIKKQHYKSTKSEDANLIKIINADKSVQGYFAKDKHYLPVFIQKSKFSYRLKQVIFSK